VRTRCEDSDLARGFSNTLRKSWKRKQKKSDKKEFFDGSQISCVGKKMNTIGEFIRELGFHFRKS
jgi:hypothetical protein